MKWHVEPWRKVYVNKSPSWLRLPVSARGLGRELVTYVDEAGAIDIGSDAPAIAIIYMLGARPDEHRRLRADVAALLAGTDPYLVHDGSTLRIRNFVPAQDRTPGAKRTATWRAKQSVTSPETSHVTSGVVTGDVQRDAQGDGDVTWDRVVSCRDDLREGQQAPRRRAERSPSSVDPAAPAWLTAHGLPPIDDPTYGAEIAKMLDWSVSAPKGAKLDWPATWRSWLKRRSEDGLAPEPLPEAPRPKYRGAPPPPLKADPERH